MMNMSPTLFWRCNTQHKNLCFYGICFAFFFRYLVYRIWGAHQYANRFRIRFSASFRIVASQKTGENKNKNELPNLNLEKIKNVKNQLKT